MPLSKQQIKDRIDVIIKRQTKLEKLVKSLQDDFFNEVLVNYEFIVSSPKKYAIFFAQFAKDFHAPILRKIVEDLRFIIQDNVDYFLAESDLQDVEKQVNALKDTLLAEFGILPSGGIYVDGYISDVITDTSVKRNFRAGLVKFGTQGQKLTNAKKQLLNRLIKGDKDSYGIWESFYAKADKGGSSIFDVYQKADRLAQNEFSTKLGMKAKMYVGGLMVSSRSFCEERNGKIFLSNEIASWSNLNFQGKPKSGYVPEIDLGGYRCRHHLSALSNATAIRLDPTIKEDSNGNLYRI